MHVDAALFLNFAIYCNEKHDCPAYLNCAGRLQNTKPFVAACSVNCSCFFSKSTSFPTLWKICHSWRVAERDRNRAIIWYSLGNVYIRDYHCGSQSEWLPSKYALKSTLHYLWRRIRLHILVIAAIHRSTIYLSIECAFVTILALRKMCLPLPSALRVPHCGVVYMFIWIWLE